MNDILTLDDLARLLVIKHDIGKDVAGKMLESFLVTIKEGLATDRYVRIKGLGTFKLIEEETGNGIAANKIIFVPDTVLKETVNKPFAHFEPVMLNDDVSFDDIEEQVLPDCSACDSEIENEPETNGEIAESPSAIEIEDKDDAKSQEHQEEKTEERATAVQTYTGNIPWCLMVLVLLVGLSLGGIISWIVLNGGSKDAIQGNEAVVDVEIRPEIVLPADTIPEIDTTYAVGDVVVEKSEIDSILKSADKVEVESEVKPMVYSDKKNYKITGTIEAHTIVRGNTLARIAYKYYKNRKMWPYIVMHNKKTIKDPNNIPIGTVINIPKLEAVE